MRAGGRHIDKIRRHRSQVTQLGPVHADLDSFSFHSFFFRPSGEHVQAADMGRVMGTLMSDQIFAGVAYSGLVTNPLFSI